MTGKQEAVIHDSANNSMNISDKDLLQDKQANWERDGERIRSLFGSTWQRHPITKKSYFDWQFLEKPKGEGIGYYVAPYANPELCAGIYVVIPVSILVGDKKIEFSTSLYTMTHPQYYKQGIFRRLATRTYEECVSKGIFGTIGIPNNNSLPGFTKALGFETIGSFQVLARLAHLPHIYNESKQIERIVSEKDLANLEFDLDKLKAASGVVLAERSPDFISWRFIQCPSVKYHVAAYVDNSNSVRGMIVVRSTKKRGIPVTVILDFLVDEAFSEADAVAATLLSEADRLAWQSFSPIIMTLVNPYSSEAKILTRQGFKNLPKRVLPHDSKFIIKLHRDLPGDLKQRLLTFENWYFSFADYDIF